MFEEGWETSFRLIGQKTVPVCLRLRKNVLWNGKSGDAIGLDFYKDIFYSNENIILSISFIFRYTTIKQKKPSDRDYILQKHPRIKLVISGQRYTVIQVYIDKYSHKK